VQPIPGSDYPTPARRPANSVLANQKFAVTFGFQLPSWQQQLDQVLAGMRVATPTNEVNR
jgi:dTDP-4-dehydrorhamnose reductase